MGLDFDDDGIEAPAIWITSDVFRGMIAVLESGIEFRQVDRLISGEGEFEVWTSDPSVFTRLWGEIGGYERFGFQGTATQRNDLTLLDVEIEPDQVGQWKAVLQSNGVVFIDEELSDGGHSGRWPELSDGRSLVTVRVGVLHRSLINRYLRTSEYLLVAGEAQRLREGNRERVSPVEGLIAITDEHFIFCSMQMQESEEIILDRHYLCSARKKRIFLPNFDRLVFEGKRYTGRWDNFEFVASKRTVAEALEVIGGRTREEAEASDFHAFHRLIEGEEKPVCVLWRSGEKPKRVQVTVFSNDGDRGALDHLASLTLRITNTDGTVIKFALSEANAFREISDPSRHKKVKADFFEGVGCGVTDFFSDGFYRVFELFFRRSDEVPDNTEREIAIYLGFPASELISSSFRWRLRDTGISQLWPIPEDSLGEDLALETHARNTLKHGYRGQSRFLRQMAPTGDSSNVLAVFPFVRHGGDDGVPRNNLGVVTEKNLWLVPHHLGQLEDDPRSDSYINSIGWEAIAGWDHHEPIWGQQFLKIYSFKQLIDPASSYEGEVKRQKGLRADGLFFWGRVGHDHVIELIIKMISEFGAFEPASRVKYS